MRPARSNVWGYFTRENNRVKCCLCGTSLSLKSSNSNMNRHMRLKHPSIDLKKCRIKKTDTDAYETKVNLNEEFSTIIVYEAVEESGQIECNETPSSSRDLEEVTPRKKKQKKSAQDNKTYFTPKPHAQNQQQKLDRQLLGFIVKDFQPFSIVDSQQFQNFVHMLNPRYEIPSKKTLANSLLNSLYDEVYAEVKKEINTVSHICITLEGWTSINNDNYYAITAHFINEDCSLKSYLISTIKFTGKHSSEDIAEKMLLESENWEIDKKIVACVTNNSANMVRAAHINKWKHVGCFAHTLNFIVQSSLESIANIRLKVKSIVDYFKTSPQAMDKLRHYQIKLNCSILEPKQDYSKRWTSTLHMFQRIMEIKEPLHSALIDLNPDSIQPPCNKEWQVIEIVCDILKPFELFEEVTQNDSSEKRMTLSKIAIFSNALLNHCNRLKRMNFEQQEILAMIEILTEGVTTRLVNKYEQLPIFWEATFLDPRFKQYGFREQNGFLFKKTKENIITKCVAVEEGGYLVHYVNNDKSPSKKPSLSNVGLGSIWSDFDVTVENIAQFADPRASSIIEVDKYLQMPLLGRVNDPLVWWNQNKYLFPHLFQLMKQCLCIIGTSVPCERIFTKRGQSIMESRRQLTSKKVPKIVFLNVNM